MTRINTGIPVYRLTDEHLLAEHREIKRLALLKYVKQLHSFTLGIGHVKFFADKQMYVYNRYMAIHQECLKRQFKVTDYSQNWSSDLQGDYKETEYDKDLLVERITERILYGKLQAYKHYGKTLTKIEALSLLHYGQY